MLYIPIIVSLLANLITNFVKPSKLGLTADEQAERKDLVRLLNAFLGLVGVIITAVLTDVDLDITAVSTYVDIIVTAIMTFGMSQGWFFLSK